MSASARIGELRTVLAMKNHKFVLAVDLDAVTGDYEEAFRQFVAKDAGVDPATMPNQKTWSMVSEGWPIRDEDHYVELHQRAVSEGKIFRDMPEIPGASVALWNLSDLGVHIRVVTHRLFANWGHLAAVTDTVAWLDAGPTGTVLPTGRRTFIPYRDICFVSDKPQIGANLYVDDAPHNITALREAGCTALIFHQLYNEDMAGLRAHDWNEVTDIVLAMKTVYDEAHHEARVAEIAQ